MNTPLLVQTFLREFGLAALCDRFALKTNRHSEFPNLVLLRYDQLNSPMADPLVHQCRGLILDEANNWDAVCVPFFKFFNATEPNAAPIDWQTARVYEKLDGSFMSLYFYAGAWRVSSVGKPDAGGSMGNLPQTMAQCFWRTWNDCGYQLPDTTWEGATFMFEFMTPWNRIIVQHQKPRIVLTGVRGADGVEQSPSEMAHMGWEIVGSIPIDSLEGALEAAKLLRPLEAEGYVVCDAAFNRVKIKSPAYMALHHLRDSFCRKRLVEIVQRGESDEFLAYFPDFEPEYRDVKLRFDTLIERVTSTWEGLPNFAPDQQRQFAEFVRATPYSAVLFALRAGKVANAKAFYAAMPPDHLLRLLDSDLLNLSP